MTVSFCGGFGGSDAIKGSWKNTYREKVPRPRIVGDASIMSRPRWLVSILACKYQGEG